MYQTCFTLDDFMSQMGQVKKLGPMGKVMGMIPGMSELTKQMQMGEGDVERQMGRMKAIYDSMNRAERKKPDLLDGGRRRRIARGAGVELNEVGQFIKQFEMSRDMMRAVGGMGMMSGGQLRAVLGLVSNDPFHCDPSYVEPHRRNRDRWHIFAALAILVALMLGYLASH